MKKTLLLIILAILITGNGLPAQNFLPIGQWRTHLPYRQGRFVAQSAETVFYATNFSLLTIDKEERSIDFLTKVDGLSNTGIERIGYNRGSETLLVVYTNSVIDLVRPNSIVTLNQIRNFTNFVGDKKIHDLFMANDSIVFLAANYGLSQLNIRSEEFEFTTFTGTDVRSLVVFEGQIYAATDEGIYRIAGNAFNPEDFSAWQWLGPDEGFPADYSASALVVFNNQIYAAIDGSLFRFGANGNPGLVFEEAGTQIQYLSAEGAHLLMGLGCAGPPCTGNGQMIYFDTSEKIGRVPNDCIGSPVFAIEDEQERIWFGDNFRGFRTLENLNDDNCRITSFNSPWSEENREITIHDDQLWLASGGVDQRFSNRFLDHGFASFIDGQWTIYNRNLNDPLKGEEIDNPFDDLLDFITIRVDPQGDKVYAGSYFEGLAVLDQSTGEIDVFNEKNSSLGNAVGDPTRTRVSGLAFDVDGNLWITNYLAERPLSVLKKDGSWENFALGCSPTEIHQVDIDQSGFKWIAVGGSQAGLALFDEGELETSGDERCRLFSTNNSNLPSNNVNCLVADLEGDVWVGTAQGVVIFECGNSAFDPNCRGSLRIVEQDGFNEYLLKTEEVQTIAVDGANRKWVGTKNGLYLLSPDGEEQIARFTTSNSPLLDNNVIDIAVSPLTGEVFIGTASGIISYQGDAIEGGRVNSSDIQVFPNPVRPGYQGPITIRGLARDANVKVTDLNGRLVFETTALGGQAIWEGRDLNGRRARSGVYLVFATSNVRYAGFNAKPSAAVARIVLIN